LSTPDKPTSDAALVLLAQGGDEDALRELWDRNVGLVRAIGRRWFGNGWLVDEVVQETWLQAWSHLDALAEPAAFAGWVMRIAERHCRRRTRAHGLDCVSLQDHEWELLRAPEPMPHEVVLARAGAEALLGSLSDRHRPVAELCLVAGMTPAEAAGELGLTPTAVKGRLQRARAALRRELEPVEKRAEEPRKQLVAVIDDEPHIVKLIEVNMRHAGYETESAADGVAGLALLSERPPDYLILDMLMPRMGGWAVLQHMRQDEQLMDIPVLVLTCVAQDHPYVQACEGLYQAYMRKPFSPLSLIAEVRSRLGVPTHLKPVLAEVRRLRFHHAADPDPMALVPIYRANADGQVREEIIRAFEAFGLIALEALVALRDPAMVFRMSSPLVTHALDRWLADDDPLMRLATLGAMRQAAQGAAAITTYATPMTDEDVRALLEQAVASLPGTDRANQEAALRNMWLLASEPARECLRRIADEDLCGLGETATGLLSR